MNLYENSAHNLLPSMPAQFLREGKARGLSSSLSPLNRQIRAQRLDPKGVRVVLATNQNPIKL